MFDCITLSLQAHSIVKPRDIDSQLQIEGISDVAKAGGIGWEEQI